MKVGIIMGSKSDLETMTKAAQVLDDFSIPYEMVIASAHRTPGAVKAYVKRLTAEGAIAFIAGAGAAAHLPGVVASYTSRPVIGVPLNATGLNGMDVQMAGLVDTALYERYQAFRADQAAKVEADNAQLQEQLQA